MSPPATIPRAALVTGGAKRLGRVIALALAEAGFSVAVHCRSSRLEAEAAAAEVRARGRAAAVFAASAKRWVRVGVPAYEFDSPGLGYYTRPLGGKSPLFSCALVAGCRASERQ